jgi:CRP/FNR family transcriptional regulator
LKLLKEKAALTNGKTLTVTYEQLANDLGTVRVVVSRILKQLENEGEIELGRNKITLK